MRSNSVFVCMCVCLYTHVHSLVWAHVGGAEVDVETFFSITSLPYFLRQGLSLNCELAILARLSPSKTLGSASLVPSTGVTDTRLPHPAFTWVLAI